MTGRSGAMADIRDMYMVHTVFRREFGLVPNLVRDVADGDTERAGIVGAHVELLCRFLHVHHESEDLILWPLLRERGGQDALSIVPTMQDQHSAMEDGIAKVTGMLGPWQATAKSGQRAALETVCNALNDVLFEHMGLEEERILPLAEKFVTADEWKQMGAHGQSLFSSKERPLVFGMAMYEAEPEVIRGVLAEAPLPVRLLVPRVAPRAFAKHSVRVHGTATPPRAAHLSRGA